VELFGVKDVNMREEAIIQEVPQVHQPFDVMVMDVIKGQINHLLMVGAMMG